MIESGSPVLAKNVSGTLTFRNQADDTDLTIGNVPAGNTTLATSCTDVTATAAEVNALHGIPVTLTATELGYSDGVTSNIQTQLNAKSASGHTHVLTAGATDITASAAELNTLDGITATVTELNYIDGVTSAIQTQFSGKDNIPYGSRNGTTASSATPTPDADSHDVYTITALAVNATFGAPTGTPTNGQKLIIRIEDNGTARTLAWNAAYRAGTDVALPLTTVLGKVMYLGFMWNSTDSKWDLLAVTGNI